MNRAKTLALCLAAAVAGGCVVKAPARTNRPALLVRITTSNECDWPDVTLENSLYRAVIRLNYLGGDYGNEHAIRDWILKDTCVDQVTHFIDSCAQRGPLTKAEVVREDADSKTVLLEYSNGAEKIIAIQELTIFRESPVIRIDYLKYPTWTNTVDIGDPGGPALEGGETLFATWAETRIYGQEEFKSQYGFDIAYHEKSYWDTFDLPYRQTAPVDGGPLNYHGHIIMAVASRESGIGFGRVMPVKTPGTGGIRILKLLWDRGFECFPATGQEERPPFTGYIFSFTNGLDDAIEMGKRIADGDMLIGNQPVVRLSSITR